MTLDHPWVKADYDAAYSLVGEKDGHPATRPGVRLHYHRSVVIPVLDRRMAALMAKLDNPKRVAIVGAGFGWGAECAQAHADCDIVSTDTSPWCQAEKSGTEERELTALIESVGLDVTQGRGLELLVRHHDGGPRARSLVENEPLTSNGSRVRLRATAGWSAFDTVISEDVFACLSDAGAVALAQNMDRMNPTANIVHTVMPFVEPEWEINPVDGGQRPGFNWKTLVQWRELLNANGLSHHKLIQSACKRCDWIE